MHVSPFLEQRHSELEAAGWKRRRGGSFMEAIGPLWARREDDRWIYGLLAHDGHLNPANAVHGGVLQTLIDHALSALAWEAASRKACVTIHADSQFISAVRSGDFIVARGTPTRQTRALVFMRGHLAADDVTVLSAQSIFKIVE